MYLYSVWMGSGSGRDEREMNERVKKGVCIKLYVRMEGKENCRKVSVFLLNLSTLGVLQIII